MDVGLQAMLFNNKPNEVDLFNIGLHKQMQDDVRGDNASDTMHGCDVSWDSPGYSGGENGSYTMHEYDDTWYSTGYSGGENASYTMHGYDDTRYSLVCSGNPVLYGRYDDVWYPPGYSDAESYYQEVYRMWYDAMYNCFPSYYCTLEYWHYVIQAILSVIGIALNVINVVTFARMGLKNTFTLILFNIGLNDLFFNVLFLIQAVSNLLDWSVAGLVTYILQKLDEKVSVELGSFELYSNHLPLSLVVVNSLLTAFLALQRCLCVVKPLHFKGMFTWKRTLFIMAFLWLFLLINLTPSIVSIVKIVIEHVNPYLIPTAFRTDEKEQAKSLKEIVDLLNSVIINGLCQVVVIVSVVIIMWKLKKSLQFRQNAGNSGHTELRGPDETEGGNSRPFKSTTKNDLSNSKEKKAIIQVTLVSVIFILTHLHFIIRGIAAFAIPYYNLYPKFIAADKVYSLLKEHFYSIN